MQRGTQNASYERKQMRRYSLWQRQGISGAKEKGLSYPSAGLGRWHVNLAFKGSRKSRRGYCGGDSLMPRKRYGRFGDQQGFNVAALWGMFTGNGDIFAWKERPASYCGRLDVKVSFWKQ